MNFVFVDRLNILVFYLSARSFKIISVKKDLPLTHKDDLPSTDIVDFKEKDS